VIASEMKRAEKLYEEQERRVDAFIKKCGSEYDMEIEEAWQNYLEDHLQFPFEAEIVDDPGPLEVGDIIKVTAIEGSDDLLCRLICRSLCRAVFLLPCFWRHLSSISKRGLSPTLSACLLLSPD